MQPVQSVHVLDQRIAKLESVLADIERGGGSADLLLRLATASPYHPALWARRVFAVLTAMGVLLLMVALLLPLISRDVANLFANIEQSIPVPLLLFLLLCSASLAIAWVTAHWAALLVARDSPKTPAEDDAWRRVHQELLAVREQAALAARVEGTPMGSNPGISSPQPKSAGMPTPSMVAAGDPPIGPPSFDDSWPSAPPPISASPQLHLTPEAKMRTKTPSPFTPVGPDTPRLSGPLAEAVGSPLSRSGTPIGAPAQTDAESTDDHLPSFDPNLNLSFDDNDQASSQSTKPSSGEWVTTTEPEAPSHAGPTLPTWGPIDEPWLEDAIAKAELLVASYPSQASILFSSEPDLPFVLVLNRVTPAMAVQHMKAFVAFLASIATPLCARIAFRNVAKIDPSFYRIVAAALGPHFADAFEIEQLDGCVDIVFLEPHQGWSRHPHLPMVG